MKAEERTPDGNRMQSKIPASLATRPQRNITLGVNTSSRLLHPTPQGLFCPAGGFHIDPWKPVPRALITHAHSDHARPGSAAYLCARSGRNILSHRMGKTNPIESLEWEEQRRLGDARVSFHPAGHLLGSAQVRVEVKGEVWVVSGDYKLAPDPSCEPFQPVTCHTFISECTFGLPVFQWPKPETVFSGIHQWWRGNQYEGRTSVLFAYALGKAQRLLAGLNPEIGPIGVHGSIAAINTLYGQEGRRLAPTVKAGADTRDQLRGKGLIIAPASTRGTPWLHRFAPYSLAFASGWMQIRGNRHRGALDRGFVISDHADWPGLLRAIDETGASTVGLTHGYLAETARWLRECRSMDTFTLNHRPQGVESEA